ncbi:hypothetical protein [Mycobacteroides abscessus]|uniref:hypothetical protein n=1 Tax=Mycobacteroides abscessus TaxID=36809 RepID=UPI0009A85550|nr:hypothetical protein [Mycobacteroides abscessus]RIT48823.1 hypothetical protein D2E80_12010 [Mycobacteroides abscessus]SKT87621.1 Uncharacterised protein [Mycobacteroides abscessus subsp. massiliense]SKU07768.1 Uncharacterised protein [Mycobacteroides abscessus subsp. massiliense]
MSLAQVTVVFNEMVHVGMVFPVMCMPVLIPVPEGVESVIQLDNGGTETFTGPWYAICDANGRLLHGWEYADFQQNAPQDVKLGPIIGYQYMGPTATVVTETVEGAVDTGKIVDSGDWFVRWRDSRKLIVMKDDEFWGLYSTY